MNDTSLIGHVHVLRDCRRAGMPLWLLLDVHSNRHDHDQAVHLSHIFFNDSSLLRALLACSACVGHWHVSCACSSHDHVYVIIRLLLDILFGWNVTFYVHVECIQCLCASCVRVVPWLACTACFWSLHATMECLVHKS